jgi:hypothetical protein
VALPLLAFLAVGLPCTAWGQTAPTSQQAQPGALTSPVDPLKRETPYGTVTGFLKAAGQKNFAGRDKILMNPVISLRYETSADQLRYVIARIREMLYRHPKVESGTLRVRFIRLGWGWFVMDLYPPWALRGERQLLRTPHGIRDCQQAA